MKGIGTLVAFAATVLGTSFSEAKRKNWIEIRTPNFLLVTDAGEKQGRTTAEQFERMRAFFRQSLAIANRHPSPFVTVLAAKDDRVMREILPQYWTGDHAHAAGVFTHRLDQYFAVVELDVQRSGHFAAFYHEYYHAITLPDFPDLPVWLSEGLADFYGRTDIGDDFVGTGRPDRDSLAFLRETPLIPLDVLFKVDHASPYYNEARKASAFYAESWLLTHYLMIGNQEAHQRLIRYLEALSRGQGSDEAVAAFGDLKKLQAELAVYLRQKKFLYVNAPLPHLEGHEPTVRALSEADTDAYLGGFSAVLGQPHQAVKSLTDILRLDANNALTYEYLGMAQFLDGQPEKALECASRAVQFDPNKSSVRYLRAYYATHGPRLLSTDVPVEDDLRRAIALSPELSPPYALLGLYRALRTPHSEEGLTLLRKALLMDPSNPTYQLDLARVLLQMKKYKEASAAASRASTLARDPAEKQAIQEFNAHLEQERQRGQPPSAMQ